MGDENDSSDRSIQVDSEDENDSSRRTGPLRFLTNLQKVRHRHRKLILVPAAPASDGGYGGLGLRVPAVRHKKHILVEEVRKLYYNHSAWVDGYMFTLNDCFDRPIGCIVGGRG